ncbi:carbamoyltransferase HypF [Poseidonibacter lekithochrous]|uniref:carbamoyltransferase HypF n=1 Tax=Poseidonibacter TaxID=2321187 RepID=UPI001C091637|nr:MULTISPECIES: carbamoyltransferase HypF [Poseidonibacter]MBU3013937.1 carbamoyltransferase HypF [Poseidonibacter lekithochrous]MDO6827232.1 carbamoyltransferase HypF [Poseidonibacter sp. 1_MG-2023]
MELCTYKINITGTVQGVGFRPFIYTLAQRYLLTGTVSNNSSGVEIIINSDVLTLKQFLIAIEYEYPLLSKIDTIEHKEIEYKTFDSFEIIKTKSKGDVVVNIPPDVSICKECERELLDPKNRRYGYPFINCTHCGVRYSIIYNLPYDRKQTSMKTFKMCKTCELEYNNPLDRRYHAQPIGCYDCGPKLKLMDNLGKLVDTRNEVDKTVKLLQEGKILALKGVGGYHLICDASNENSIQELRKRKKRETKPFAVMVSDMKMARELAIISKQEENLLLSKERPIVIVKKKNKHLNNIAPNISYIGLFLPYTPLHLLLLKKLKSPIVATSANVTDEPICTNLESLEKLQEIYDYVLDHNRDIINGCDDSVFMVVKEKEVAIRRSRGYAPIRVTIPFFLKNNVLALGANQKSTIAIGFNNQVILSPHIGDLHSISSVEYYEKNIETLERIYNFKAKVIAYDKHPNYESTKVANKIIKTNKDIIAKKVQHHYSHILAVMAEKNIKSKVFGVAFDGTGYGDDGMLWGGEFMVCDFEDYKRIASLEYFKLLGGAKAIKEPRRVALSILFSLYGKDVFNLDNPTTRAFSSVELRAYYTAWEKGLNSPLSSSVGRLFDAVASLLGICQVMSFEGESGMLLEELFDSSVIGYYPFNYENEKIDILPILPLLLKEKDISIAVSKFFYTLVEVIVKVYEPYDLPLVLSGGVFQNRVLLGLVLDRFPKAIISNAIPPNDGGIALGQVMATINTKE